MTPSKAKVLIVDDEPAVRSSLLDFLVKLGYQVSCCENAESATQKLAEEAIDICLLDIRLPGKNGLQLLSELGQINPNVAVVIITGHGTVETAVQALRLGACDFLRKPIKLLELEAAMERCCELLASDEGHLGTASPVVSMHSENRVEMVGQSLAANEIREQIRLAAESGCETLLLYGETGTGKEVAAELFHSIRHGDHAPYIVVNCPALPDNLVESELFGHAKGAFTGATEERIGAFRSADNGTLFLDEVADLALPAQAKLLRAIDYHLVKPVGTSEEREVKVTVIAASNQSLRDCVKVNKFRQDLLYRLDAFSIYLPPLRERRQDIKPLTEHFLNSYAKRVRKPMAGISESAVDALLTYNYPGNIRELRNIIERACILSRGETITQNHIQLERDPLQAGMRPEDKILTPVAAQAQSEMQETLSALEHSGWNRRKAAELLGISYDTLRWRIKKHHLSE